MFVNCSKKDQAETQNSFKKGPGYVLILLEYNIPSKKGQAMTHNSFKKGPSHNTLLLQKRTRLLLKFLPKTLICHADNIYRLWVGFDKIGQEFSTIDFVAEHLLPACGKGGFALSGWHGNKFLNSLV